MILDEIVKQKREEVAQAKARMTRAELERRAAVAAPARDFRGALAEGPGVSVIAECKKASPSKGVIRADYQPAAIARSYEAHGAAAISCLTDERFFQGSLDDLGQVRQATGLPVLRKEFIIDEAQILETRAAGADAVLLICSILERTQLRDFVDVARGLGMAALVELYDLAEIDDAVEFNTGVIGVNNRDLRTFAVDLEHTAEVARLLPDELLLVSESGIATREDVAFVQAAGAKAILVGTAFMSRPDPGQALAELMAGKA